MKKFIALSLVLFRVLLSVIPCAAAPSVSAQSYIVTEASTGRILCQKDANRSLAMASTTKIMTALVALEHANPEDTVTVSASAAATEGSSMYLNEGEVLSIRELLYGLMLASGNDAAVVIAEHFGGTEPFVRMMNEKATALGMTHTHFANPNGLPDDTHRSTAEDMARLTAYALQNPTFAEIVATRTYRIDGNGKAYPRVLTNHNKLLNFCKGCIGVKTGFTKAAGRCLVSAVRREEMTLICVTLNAPDDWNDHQALYQHCFDTYRMTSVLDTDTLLGEVGVSGSDTTVLPYRAAEAFSYPLREDETLSLSDPSLAPQSAPVSENAVCGSISIRLGDTCIKTVSLLTANGAERNLLFKTVRQNFLRNLERLCLHWMTVMRF